MRLIEMILIKIISYHLSRSKNDNNPNSTQTISKMESTTLWLSAKPILILQPLSIISYILLCLIIQHRPVVSVSNVNAIS